MGYFEYWLKDENGKTKLHGTSPNYVPDIGKEQIGKILGGLVSTYYDTTDGYFAIGKRGKFLYDFEYANDAAAQADWTETLDADAVLVNTGYVKEGNKSMELPITYSGGTALWTSSVNHGDLSAYTGVASGTPTKGYLYSWAWVEDILKLTTSDALKLKIGSSNVINLSTGFESDVVGTTPVGWTVTFQSGANPPEVASSTDGQGCVAASNVQGTKYFKIDCDAPQGKAESYRFILPANSDHIRSYMCGGGCDGSNGLFLKTAAGAVIQQIIYTNNTDIFSLRRGSAGVLTPYIGQSVYLEGIGMQTGSWAKCYLDDIAIEDSGDNPLSIPSTTVYGYTESVWDRADLINGWNFLISKLSTATVVGTPDWTSADHSVIEMGVNADTYAYIDDMRIAKSHPTGDADDIELGDEFPTNNRTNLTNVLRDATTAKLECDAPAGTLTNDLIQEFAILNAASGGDMLARTVLNSPFNKTVNDTLFVRYYIKSSP